MMRHKVYKGLRYSVTLFKAKKNAICRMMVEKILGGKLLIESGGIGKGTTVTVILPNKPARM